MAYPPIQVANKFLADHPEAGIDHLQLQKLLYFANGWWLAMEDEDLLSERPQVWRFGPVYRSIYRIFSRYAWQPIASPEPKTPFTDEPNLPTPADPQGFDKFMNWIWNEYGHLSGTTLSEMTHASGTPWREIAEECKFEVPRNTTIPLERDRAYFKGLATERGFIS